MGPGEDSNITCSVHLVALLVRCAPKTAHKVFESSRKVSQTLLPGHVTRPRRVLLRWCPGEDLNLHALRHYHLKVASIPISPPGQTQTSLFMVFIVYSKDFLQICKLSCQTRNLCVVVHACNECTGRRFCKSQILSTHTISYPTLRTR